jgi:V8-like Glu-specific endopeptidase
MTTANVTPAAPAPGPKRTGKSISVQVVIPGHPLVRVPDPNLLDYYRCVGQFVLIEPGATFTGTGTLIKAGDNIGILTCAHNLTLDNSNVLIDSATFTPSQTPTGSPFAAIPIPQSKMWISPGYYLNPVAGNRYDYAVVKLKASDVPYLNKLGPLPQMATLTLSDSIGVQVTGYPTEAFGDNGMGYSTGNFTPAAVQAGLVYYNASTAKGSSGSGVCFVNNLEFITGVHVAGDASQLVNWGVYLTPEIIQEITEVLAT